MWGDSFSTVGIPSVLWGYLQYCESCSVQWGITSVHWRITSVHWRDNISTVEGIQYSGGRILISACLVINNDEKISTFFVLRYEMFIWKFSSRCHAF